MQPPLPLSDNMNGKKISRRKNSVGIFILDVYLFNGQGGVYASAERYANGKQRRQSHIYHVARIERNYKATVIQRAYSHRQYAGNCRLRYCRAVSAHRQSNRCAKSRRNVGVVVYFIYASNVCSDAVCRSIRRSFERHTRRQRQLRCAAESKVKRLRRGIIKTAVSV